MKYSHAGEMSYEVFSKFYNTCTLIEPVLLYECGIGGVNKYREVSVILHKACTYFLGASRRASNLALRGDMVWHSCNVNQFLETIRLCLRII